MDDPQQPVSDIARAAEVSGSSRPRLDRRSLLAKGAVVGGLAWTVPVITAGRAGAVGCTPKCSFADFSLTASNFTAVDICNPGTADGYPAGLGATKAAEFTVTIAGVCPCSGSPVVVLTNGVSANWDKQNSCPATYSGANASAVVNANDPTKFLLYKAGALGNGFYVPQSFCMAVKCTDRSNQIVYKRCSFALCIGYSPASSCGLQAGITVTATVIANSCTSSCSHC